MFTRAINPQQMISGDSGVSGTWRVEVLVRQTPTSTEFGPPFGTELQFREHIIQI